MDQVQTVLLGWEGPIFPNGLEPMMKAQQEYGIRNVTRLERAAKKLGAQFDRIDSNVTTNDEYS